MGLFANLRGVINGKADKAADLPKFLDTLTLSQSGGSDYAHPLALDYAPDFFTRTIQLCLFLSTTTALDDGTTFKSVK